MIGRVSRLTVLGETQIGHLRGEGGVHVEVPQHLLQRFVCFGWVCVVDERLVLPKESHNHSKNWKR